MSVSQSQILSVLRRLDQAFPLPPGWPDGDWPVSGAFEPERFEVVLGAILTQNTDWRNVEKALERLAKRGLAAVEPIAACTAEDLEDAVRPAGYFRQKSRYIKEVAAFIRRYPGEFFRDVTREELLSIRGIGPETADSILLYACQRPHFVVDTYTRRVFSRYGWLSESVRYEEMKEFFESRLPVDLALYKRSHALIVEQAKQVCRKKPLCEDCVLRGECATALCSGE